MKRMKKQAFKKILAGMVMLCVFFSASALAGGMQGSVASAVAPLVVLKTKPSLSPSPSPAIVEDEDLLNEEELLEEDAEIFALLEEEDEIIEEELLEEEDEELLFEEEEDELLLEEEEEELLLEEEYLEEDAFLEEEEELLEEDELLLEEELPEEEAAPEFKTTITSNASGVQLQFGEVITLSATVEGIEDRPYQVCWKYNDGNGWVSLDGANGLTYTFVLDDTTFFRAWGIDVFLLEPEA